MNTQERTLARKQFQLKIYESNGQAFEDLFIQIMNYHKSDFQSIKPWGNIGDRKNDGYIRSKGVFFQVFAPEEITKSYVKVVNKLVADFNGLNKHWSPINEFYFVVNDKYLGVNADCDQTMQKLAQDFNLKNAGFKTPKDLENILFSLDDDQILMVIGNLPDPANINLDYSIMSEIIGYLMNLSLVSTNDSSLIYPDWDKKIIFNELGELEATYLNNGYMQIGSLDSYLNNQSNFFADKVKDKIREVYVNCSANSSGNDLFWKMVAVISPNIGSAFQSSVIILIAKYFETCDVFEEPQ
ncbi:MAG: hypothetical protein L3J83_01090 [Proteobacteria bacterium]|nr:hypothetical protein [Pseudomonadota bacterium]